MRRAKIVATLGPASSTVDGITHLINVGMNIARINMSHGTQEEHATLIKNIREASAQSGWEVGILMDLQGPKIRVSKLDSPLILKSGEEWLIGHTSLIGKYPNNFIPTVYEKLVKDADVGDAVLFDDGLIEAKVTGKDGEVLKIIVINGGELKSKKGINLPDTNVSAPSLTEKDHEDLLFGIQHEVDYVALSFVRSKHCIEQVKTIIEQAKADIPVVAKIEKPEAIKNIDEITDVTDVIMVARGDMAVELGNHLVPAIQKRIIGLCNSKGVPVITATQMLESMITNPRPTRAEASDVANAIWDGTDAVMLSAETASGSYPAESIDMMGQIIEEAEKEPKERPLLRHVEIKDITASIQVAASLIAEKIEAKRLLVVTESGRSCLKLSRFRPRTRVLGITNNLKAVRRMCLYWGISPYFIANSKDVVDIENHMIKQIQKENIVDIGDEVVIARGTGEFFSKGTSSTVRVETISDSSLK